MSLIVQSSGDSFRTAASSDISGVWIDNIPALTAGDVLVLAVSSTHDADLITYGIPAGGSPLDAVHSPFAGGDVRSFPSATGRVTVFYVNVPTKAAADELKAYSQYVIASSLENITAQMTAALFRVTGADFTRFVEDAKVVTGDLSADGELSMPSFDPEYRRDNTLLFVASATFPRGASTPVITAAGSTPLAAITALPPEETGEGEIDPEAGETGEEALGITTSLSIRSLSSADPTGVTPIAYSSQPASGLGVALMLRSANRPPEIALAAEWAAEVGKEAVVSATVTDPDFTPVSYVWSQIDGPEEVTIGNVYARAFNFIPSLPGIYRFRLRATDVDGGRTELTTSVIVPTGTVGPAEVIAQAGWTDADGGQVSAADLGDSNDATFARTVDLPVGDPLTVRLNPIYGGAPVTLTVRGVASNPSPAIRRSLTLKQSDGTLIAERFYTLPTVMGSYVFKTTRNETALITNRSAMTLTIVDEVA